jgi:hypothetical protein
MLTTAARCEDGRVPAPLRLRPERTTWFAAAFFLLSSLPLVASSTLLLPLLAVPLGAFVWCARARVVAAPVGLEVCNGLLPHRTTWDDVEGFDLPPRGAPVVVLRDGRRWRMTAIDRRRLPQVLAVHDDAVRSRS